MISESAIKAVFERSLKIKPEESCLIVTDTVKEPIARPFYDYVKKIVNDSRLDVIEPRKEHGEEPPTQTAQMMLGYDVVLLITAKSLSHTRARRNATEKGSRIASMPTITEDVVNRCLDIDYDELQERCRHLYDIISHARTIKITTELGTDFEAQIGDRKICGDKGGTFDYKGAFGNLPEGEISFSPTNSNGVYIVDASFPEFGKLSSPLTFRVKDGRVNGIEGKKADEVKARLDSVGEKAFLIAEVGIGTNPNAIITGNVLEDEKVSGTVHIAVGNNLSYDGDNDIPLHLDGVITRPHILLDGTRLPEESIWKI